MKMSKWTIENIAEAKAKGLGKKWENEKDAPVSWKTMKNYPEVFELNEYWSGFEDDYTGEEYGSWVRFWKFK